jgi:hypothetical protein
MTRTTSPMRLAMGLALLAPVLLAGCGGSDQVQRTTTTERTTTVAPGPMQVPTQSSTSTTTTTTRAPN